MARIPEGRDLFLAWIENKDGLAKVRLTTDEENACSAKGKILYREVCGMCGCLTVMVSAGGGKLRLDPMGGDHATTCPARAKPAAPQPPAA
jgi:hypothetical protein